MNDISFLLDDGIDCDGASADKCSCRWHGVLTKSGLEVVCEGLYGNK